jgi:outer membrane protein assembly factor BamB
VFYAVDALTGTLRWSAPTQGEVHSRPAIGVRGLVLATDNTRLYAFDPKTGVLHWSFSIPAGDGTFSSPTFGNINGRPLVFVGTSVGILAVDNDTGAKAWEQKLNAPVDGTPLCVCKTFSSESPTLGF